jgi:hypothetical protein
MAVGFGLALLAGCGDPNVGSIPEVETEPSSPATTTLADAKAAFRTLGDLNDAWKSKDCAKIASLTTGAVSALGGHACSATRNGRPVPEPIDYTDAEFFLATEIEDGAWFAALARKPEPAYFVFAQAEGHWRLAAGPIKVVGDIPRLKGDTVVPADDPATDVTARLVPTRHLAFLTDPAGVSGIRFPSGDPMRKLLDELLRKPVKARPDRLSVDVRPADRPRSLMLPDGGALVFHALTVVYQQKPGPGRSSLAHPLYGTADVRAFTGKSSPAAITGTELLLIATKVAGPSKMTTVALRRVLTDITAD